VDPAGGEVGVALQAPDGLDGLQVHDEAADGGGKPQRLAASEPKGLSIPSSPKRTTLRCSVRSEAAPGYFARSEAGLPNSTEGRMSS
jgi:hypothetical protein